MAIGVSKEFIDEITVKLWGLPKLRISLPRRLAAPLLPRRLAARLATAGQPIPRRLRKLEGSYERNEIIKMRRFHYESALAAAASLPSAAEPLQAPVGLPPAAFGTGQSVHHWWSSWFKTAEVPRPQLQGNNRPKWYDASIVCALGVKRVKYSDFKPCTLRNSQHKCCKLVEERTSMPII